MTLVDQLSPVEQDTQYRGWLSLAREKAQRCNLEVGIIARNAGPQFAGTLRAVTEVAAYFKTANLRVLTNDCTDCTCDILRAYSGVSLDWVHEENGRPFMAGSREFARTIALAEYRNRVREMVRKNPEPVDAVLILDADLLEVTAERLMAGFGEFEDLGLDAMAAQCLVRYAPMEPQRLISYDAYAYRPTWTDTLTPMIEKAFHYDVRPSGVESYRVRSAFGGAAWYYGPTYLDETRQYDGAAGCEHVPFHRGMDMHVSPSMTVIGFL